MSATSTPTTPSSLLDAVNALLIAVRISPVFSLLSIDTNEDASGAKVAIDAASLEVQQQGWWFNREPEVVIDPSETGEIVLAANVLEAKTSRCWSGNKLVQRGTRMFDRTARTYSIGTAATFDLIVALPFESMPFAARNYVTGLAARRWCIPRLPSGVTFSYTEEYLQTALNAMMQADADAEDTDLKQTSPHFAMMTRR